MDNTLGQFIRLRRMELGLTQEQLAQRVSEGVGQAEISRLERDQVALPRRPRMEQLAKALEIPLGVLLARSGWTGAEEIQAASQGNGSVRAALRASIDELRASNDELQASNDVLRASLTELLGGEGDPYPRTDEPDTMAIDEETTPHQLPTMLNEVDDAAAVVAADGTIMLKNDAYDSIYAGHPVMVDVGGEPVPDDATPVQRAARRERFSMTFGLDHFGSRTWYWAEGKPMSTNEGEMVGVVTIREILAPTRRTLPNGPIKKTQFNDGTQSMSLSWSGPSLMNATGD